MKIKKKFGVKVKKYNGGGKTEPSAASKVKQGYSDFASDMAALPSIAYNALRDLRNKYMLGMSDEQVDRNRMRRAMHNTRYEYEPFGSMRDDYNLNPGANDRYVRGEIGRPNDPRYDRDLGGRGARGRAIAGGGYNVVRDTNEDREAAAQVEEKIQRILDEKKRGAEAYARKNDPEAQISDFENLIMDLMNLETDARDRLMKEYGTLLDRQSYDPNGPNRITVLKK